MCNYKNLKFISLYPTLLKVSLYGALNADLMYCEIAKMYGI